METARKGMLWCGFVGKGRYDGDGKCCYEDCKG